MKRKRLLTIPQSRKVMGGSRCVWEVGYLAVEVSCGCMDTVGLQSALRARSIPGAWHGVGSRANSPEQAPKTMNKMELQVLWARVTPYFASVPGPREEQVC